MRRAKLPILITFVVTLLLQANLWACLNDRDSDTLAQQAAEVRQDTAKSQASGLPDVLRVITGRFERNPPLFYAMRLKRVTAQLRAHPRQLALYDDAAVACDRLEHDAAAIAWIEKKRQQLVKLDTSNKAVHEHWYRYYANVGTFWAHHWLRAGANPQHLAEVKRARDCIAKAIKLKPNAHFGRERYQLLALQWIIRVVSKPQQKDDATSFSFAQYMEGAFNEDRSDATREKMIEGLTGLIVLGNAWESVDIFDALTSALQTKATLQYLASLRCSELIDQGHRSIDRDSGTGRALKVSLSLMVDDWTNQLNEPNQKTLQTLYRRLRVEAEQWHKQRTAYMMGRLTAGRHPDTDPTFWRDYHDPGPPSLQVPWYSERAARRLAAAQEHDYLILVVVGILILCILICYPWHRIAQRRKQRRAALEAHSITIEI